MLRRATRGLWYVAEWMLRLPWPPSVRSALFRRLGADIGRDTRIHRCHLVNLNSGGLRNLRIGPSSHIGPECLLDLASTISFGSRVTVSPGVVVLTHSDPGKSRVSDKYPPFRLGVAVGDDAWIGARALLLAGTTVGEAAVVGAGAVVTKPVRRDTTVVGVPAVPVGDAR